MKYNLNPKCHAFNDDASPLLRAYFVRQDNDGLHTAVSRDNYQVFIEVALGFIGCQPTGDAVTEQYLKLEAQDWHDHPKFTMRWRYEWLVAFFGLRIAPTICTTVVGLRLAHRSQNSCVFLTNAPPLFG